MDSRCDQFSDVIHVGNKTQTDVKKIQKIGEVTLTNIPATVDSTPTQQTENTEEVRVSPYGFGPYPDVPQSGRFGC